GIAEVVLLDVAVVDLHVGTADPVPVDFEQALVGPDRRERKSLVVELAVTDLDKCERVVGHRASPSSVVVRAKDKNRTAAPPVPAGSCGARPPASIHTTESSGRS